MNTFDLHGHIAAALSTQWSEFESAHPALAAVIDQSLLVHTAATSLKNDPEFQQAVTVARKAGVGQAVITSVLPLIERYAIGFLEKLL